MLTINRVITLPSVSNGYSDLYCRSGARSAASWKSVERSGERKLQKNGGAERNVKSEVTERGAGVLEIGWSAEWVFRRSHSVHIKRMKGWVGLVGRPAADGLLKWSPVSCRSSTGQGKFARERPRFFHCATQPAGNTLSSPSHFLPCRMELRNFSAWNVQAIFSQIFTEIQNTILLSLSIILLYLVPYVTLYREFCHYL